MFLIGLICCAIAGLHARIYRGNLTAPLDTSDKTFSRLKVGMTPEEVHYILGSPGYLPTQHGAKKFVWRSGDIRHMEEHPYYIDWWENEFAIITITFSGTRGDVRAIELARTVKSPKEMIESLAPRGVCLILLAIALILFARSLRGVSLNPTPTSDRTDGTVSR